MKYHLQSQNFYKGLVCTEIILEFILQKMFDVEASYGEQHLLNSQRPYTHNLY